MGTKVRYLVVGGGISGLAFADWLKSDDYLICEADDAIGGYCKTIQQDGFVWDYSGHFFHFRRPEIEAYLLERMNDQKILRVEKDSRVFWDGEHIDFPFQKNIHQLPREDFLACLRDLYEANEAAKDGAQTHANFRDMLYAKFGEGIAERFLVPYNEKLYATDLAKLDPDAMGRFFPYADLGDVIRNFHAADNGSYNATFTYPQGGAIQYVQALAKGVDPAKISLGERVLSVDVHTRTATTNKRTIEYEMLVSSAPFPRVLEMAGMPAPVGDTYDWNVVEVFNLGFDRKGPIGPHWIYYPQRELSFYRVGFYDNIFGTDRMSMYVELGRERGYGTDDATKKETLATVLADLEKVGVVDGHELVSHHHILLDPAYVHITSESNAAVAAAKRSLATRGVFTFGRYGSWTYCSIEDNIVEARALADACNAAGM
ncbi:MAG: FAD-dependent oxidoreductase [Myxococcota bacterium]